MRDNTTDGLLQQGVGIISQLLIHQKIPQNIGNGVAIEDRKAIEIFNQTVREFVLHLRHQSARNEMRFNNTLIEEQFVQAAREHFASVFHSLIANCRQRDAEELAGPDHFFVNDKQEYITWNLSTIDNVMTTQSPSFTILQHAHYLQTGEMIALLP